MNDLAHITDPYRAGESILHRMDARIKLVLTLTAILVSALLPNGTWAAYILLAAGIWCWAILSGLGLGFVLKRSLIAIPFALAALPLPFTLPSDVAWPVQILEIDFTIGQAGLVRLLSIALKSWLSVHDDKEMVEVFEFYQKAFGANKVAEFTPPGSYKDNLHIIMEIYGIEALLHPVEYGKERIQSGGLWAYDNEDNLRKTIDVLSKDAKEVTMTSWPHWPICAFVTDKYGIAWVLHN